MDEFIAGLAPEEFVAWQAYDLIQGLPDARADLRHGIATAALANINRDSRTRSQPYSPADFIPSLTIPDEPKAEDARTRAARHLAMMQQLHAASGGRRSG